MTYACLSMDQLTREEVADAHRRFGALMLRRCRLVLRDDALAEDAFQDAFIKLIRHGRAFRTAEKKLQWLIRLCTNCCFDLLARRKKSREREQLDPDPVRPHPIVDVELRDAAMRVLDELDDDERTIAVLAFVDGLSKREIGERLGWSRQTVYVKLRAIRDKAQRRLGRAIDE